MHDNTTRRQFLQQSTEAAALVAAVSALGGVQTFGADPGRGPARIIGCGGIMGLHVKGLVGRKEAVSIAWLCDVDPRQIDRMAGFMAGSNPRRPSELHGSRRTGRQGRRRVYHRTRTTGTHNRTAAMQEGKDVYIEKPISHAYNEGPLIIAAAKKYGRVVQQGARCGAAR